MELNLLVDQLNDTEIALQNCFIHCQEDISEPIKYLEIDDKIYKSLGKGLIKGQLLVGNIQRLQLGLERGKNIKVIPVESIKKNFLKNLHLQISFRSKIKVKSLLSIHEDEFIDEFKTKFKDYYISNNLTFIFKFNDILFTLTLNTDKQMLSSSYCKGFLDDDTKIDLITNEVFLNFISKEILKRDFFRKDFNFEEIGIGGLNEQLAEIMRLGLTTRTVDPRIIEKLGIIHNKGILLYGPPGTGKTLIARNIGKKLTPLEPKIINGPEILNKFVGQSEENLRNIFQDAKIDQQQNGINSYLHVIIFDEFDAICKARGRSGVQSGVNDTLVNQLLSVIQGVDELHNIFIIAMTNRKDLIDEAVLRPGRIGIHIEIKLPDEEGRKQIFNIHTLKMRTNQMVSKDIDIDKLAFLTTNFSGAEIAEVVNNAASIALYENMQIKNDLKEEDIIVKMEHFLTSVNRIDPAFGDTSKEIYKLLPKKIKEIPLYEELDKLIIENKKLCRILIYGENGKGKTITAIRTAFRSNVIFKKIIMAINVVTMEDHTRSEYFINMIKDSYLSENSLIVLDDVEILINYANLNNNISFSNKLYQTFLTMMKTIPNNRTTILVTCSDENLVKIIEPFFDKKFEIM